MREDDRQAKNSEDQHCWCHLFGRLVGQRASCPHRAQVTIYLESRPVRVFRKSGPAVALASRSSPEARLYQSHIYHRARHIKCDSAKPICLRCSSSGHRCGGYGFQPKHFSWLYRKPTTKSGEAEGEGSVCHDATIITPRLSLLDLPGISSYERRNFELFRLQTAQDLSGLFQSDFWTSVVPQVSHSEPAVLHASVALGALHQKSVMSGMSVPMQDMKDKVVQFSLSQFNQSINLLKVRAEHAQDRESGQALLICCILFISIEILLGHYGTAMLHLHNGCNILYNSLANRPCVGPDDTLTLSSTSRGVEDEPLRSSPALTSSRPILAHTHRGCVC